MGVCQVLKKIKQRKYNKKNLLKYLENVVYVDLNVKD